MLEKFEEDKDSLSKQTSAFGNVSVKTVSLKAWIKRNDTKYSRPVIDDWYRYGTFNILGCERNIQINLKGTYDTYEDLVDEVFHRQLKKCELEEKKYFLEHDEYSILKRKFKDYSNAYSTTFGAHITTSSDENVYVGENFESKREITIDELKDLLTKYEQLDALVEKLTAETHIV